MTSLAHPSQSVLAEATLTVYQPDNVQDFLDTH